MSDAELFHEVMKPLGGRYPRENVAPALWEMNWGHIIRLAETLIASAREHCPGLPPIYFDIVRNETINACAFKSEGRYFIAFNTGTRYMLELIFGRMLSDPELFDFVPTPSGEDSNLPPLKYSVYAEEMYQAGIRPVVPKTVGRWSYGYRLLEYAFTFLIGHEIAHITLGHVDYLLSKTGNCLFPELGWNLPTQGDEIERQAIEAEADFRSVNSAIASAKLTHEALLPEDQSWINTRRSVVDLLYDWSFAINTACRIFGDVQVNESKLSASSYPPLALRRFMAMLNAHMLVVQLWNPPDAKLTTRNALMSGALYTEIAFLKITNQKYGGKGLYQVLGGLGLEYVKKIRAYWYNTLVAKLQPFAYENPFLLNPDEHTKDALTRANNS